MILIAYRHGLRVSELVALRWDQIDFTLGHLQVRRLKGGIDSVHPLSGREIRALRRLKRESPPDARFVFLTERGGPMTANSCGRMLTRTAESTDFPLKVHPHMLRHGVGFKLANAGHDTRAIQHYLGHKDIKHTVRYTALLQRPPAWAASGRVRLGRGPSTMQGHPSCRSKRMPLGAITSPSRSTGSRTGPSMTPPCVPVAA